MRFDTALFGLLRLGAAAPAVLFAQAAFAQQDVPPGTLPSREETAPPVPDAQQQGTVSIDSRAATPVADCPFADSTLTLNLAAVDFTRPDGSPVAPEIAQTLSRVGVTPGTYPLAKICDIRTEAGNALRADGWIASVQVPPQTIDGDRVKMTVITAKITEMRVRGEPGRYRRMLEDRIAQLKALDPLNEKDAERILLLTGDIPGLDVQLALRPAGTVPGEVIGDLAIDYANYAIIANAQNYNSSRLGRETGYLRGEIYGLTGMGDVTFLASSATFDLDEQAIIQGGHSMIVDALGSTLSGQITYARSRPDLGALNLQTNTLIGQLDYAYPLVRSVGATIMIAGSFEYVDQKTVVRTPSGDAPLSQDNIRALSVRIDGALRKFDALGMPKWWVDSEVEVRKGLDILGASKRGSFAPPLPSRIEGNAAATIVRVGVEATFNLASYVGVYGKMQAQWADTPLLNYDEYSIGNLTVGRGYDPGSNSADRAVALRGELRANVPVSPKVNTQVFGFYDWVRLDNLDRNSIEDDRTLRSYGGGMRITIPRFAQLEVMYAHPLDKALTFDAAPPPDRVLVSLTFQFRQ